MKTSYFAIAVLFVVAVASSAAAQSLDVTITCDNAYGFGFGPESGMTTYYGGLRNTLPADISGNPAAQVTGPVLSPYINTGVGAEIYNVPAPVASDYVYIVAWDDGSQCQGVLASFQLGNDPVATGGSAWRVFATGVHKSSNSVSDTLTAADLPDINAQIQIANANGGATSTTSIGWVNKDGCLPGPFNLPHNFNLAIGERNDHLGALCDTIWPSQPMTPEISPTARWMWYDSHHDPLASDPFRADSYNTSTPHDSDYSPGHDNFAVGYLIFRLPMSAVGVVSPEPSSVVLLGMGAFGLVAYAWRRRR
jgi:hypothetical protein